MKQYPSIPSCSGQSFREIPNAYIFDKLDGSNLRFEWSRKRGFYKSGTRHRMFDGSDPVFGGALSDFNKISSGLHRVATDERWESAVFFVEWYGTGSFAGYHTPGDTTMQCRLIDVSVHRHGFLSPRDYLDLFRGVPQAAFLGRQNWTRGLLADVWDDKVEGVTFEGVVAKAGSGDDHDRVMAKGKTRQWIEAVRARMSPDKAEEIINS